MLLDNSGREAQTAVPADGASGAVTPPGARPTPPLRRVVLHVALWTGIALFTGTQRALYILSTGAPVQWGTEYLVPLWSWHVWGLVSIGILRAGRRFPIGRDGWPRQVAIHVPFAFLFSLIDIVLCYPVRQALGTAHAASLPQFALAEIGFDFLLYWATLGVGHAFDYHAKYRERELVTSRLETRLAQAQLQSLRSRLQPHFLFNTLNAISTLMHKDPAAADRMIVSLSDLLRTSIDGDGDQEVPLRREIDLVERYLGIMQARFQERLDVSLRIDPAVLDAPVPHFLLQPLVENAILHGVGRRLEGGRVEISARVEKGALAIDVRDDGPGLAVPPADALTLGLGLSNTRARLVQLYGDRQRFEIANEPSGGVRVSVVVPLAPRRGGSRSARPPRARDAAAGATELRPTGL